MRIYFSGIGGVGIGPLLQITRDAGYEVAGSDLQPSAMTDQLQREGIDVIFNQDGTQIAELHSKTPIDWFVYTAALDKGKPELDFCIQNGIKTSKRDGFLAEIIREKNLKMIAVAGTHGKTTTSGLMVWTMKQLEIPVSYSVGTSLSFGPSGAYDPSSEYFVYECDEYDRNMLHFEPFLSLITSLDYDHPDTYPTRASYQQAFVQFLQQSQYSLLWEKDLRALGMPDIDADYEAYDELMDLSDINLPGRHVRQNAFLVRRALERLFDQPGDILPAINTFPGTARRMEKLADNLYSDYGHHPAEIAATLQLARELSDHVVLIYQPHQNVRQHEIRDQYTDCMELAEEIYWLPTYLSREDPNLEVLTPEQLSAHLTNRSSLHIAELNDQLWHTIKSARSTGKLVLAMGAGSIDSWLRKQLS